MHDNFDEPIVMIVVRIAKLDVRSVNYWVEITLLCHFKVTIKFEVKVLEL